MKLLDGQVVLVTGAARGLGWGIARAFGQAGAKVCVTDINMQELARAERDLRADEADVLALPLDVSDLAAWDVTVQWVVEQCGRLDVLVHNAIFMPLVSFEDTSPELWWQQLQVSLGGLFNGTRAVWEVMKRQGGGHIMGIASGSSVRGFKDEVTYCTGKHGQEGFVKALSLEAAPYNIAINTVGPGKMIKPTRIDWATLDAMPAAEKAGWADPVVLGQGFVWLAGQPPSRFTGLRFDAGPISDTLACEGPDFAFAPEKVTLNPDDFVARQQWYANYPD
ncbi:MAG: SDR family oxidoreductase [Herpetosiphonaceae bacterium]|nr:SDR family oxidoreductase [Herpetosiphonaceae bacterium]